ncbi:MAG: hypothetical protein WDZ51_04675 [Pirellulaceae bacterium]
MNPRRLFACQMVLIGLFTLFGIGLLATSAEQQQQLLDCQILEYKSLVGDLIDRQRCCL